jgi:GNAT superfamily N-acetyltransferase
MVGGLTIAPLGAHPALVRTTVGWHLTEFDRGGDAAFWLRERAREMTHGGIPSAWIAFVGEVPVGSVSLIADNMETHPERTPWLAALYVLPGYRGRGIGVALVQRCEQEARAAGATRLFLHTERSHGVAAFYARLGWTVFVEDEEFEGVPVVVMERDLRGA